MIDKIYCADVQPDMEGKRVKLAGWVYRKREVGKKVFIVLRDSSGIIQTIFKKELSEEAYETAKKAGIESSVIIEGTVKADPRAPTGVEIQADRIEIVQNVDFFPITKDASEEFLLDVRHLHLHSPKVAAIMKVKATMMQAAREWLLQDGWYEVFPPILVTGAVEGGATLFKLKYFDKTAYLSQSAQLYLEAAIFGLEKVWSLTPSFRAEKSRTRRHLTEFWHLELEGAWMDLWDIMKVEEELVSYMVQRTLELRRSEIETFRKDLTTLKNAVPPFPRVSYDEAIDILQSKGVEIEWGEDMGADEERILTQEFEAPFFVYGYPKGIKAFYMKEDPEDPRKVLAADMLAPEGYGEIIGGSQREDDYNKLVQRILEEGMKPEDYEWYLDLRKYGSVPHSGFGLGLERLVAWVLKLDHVRWATLFPRTPSRLYP
ncbi:asparagine--tRNA ligase [Thermococcus sp. 18S1]|uniref:asparagine--tRNA ligase n=1 Tax=Thermococcus sp. 18S1 TaxID=1638210 RepID=UPI00143B8433|nr:asparagine--tRNA ligase [Thermococcus sp. 18S1]NJE29466.1 asparagine--tRNA ligase [Thermococcus sp. 18S1]